VAHGVYKRFVGTFTLHVEHHNHSLHYTILHTNIISRFSDINCTGKLRHSYAPTVVVRICTYERVHTAIRTPTVPTPAIPIFLLNLTYEEVEFLIGKCICNCIYRTLSSEWQHCRNSGYGALSSLSNHFALAFSAFWQYLTQPRPNWLNRLHL